MNYDIILWPIVIALVGGVAFFGLWLLGAWVSPEENAWRSIAKQRGYSTTNNPLSKFIVNLSFTRRFFADTDIRHLLLIAGREESPLGFWSRSLGLGILVFIVLLGLDIYSGNFNGGSPVLPFFIPLIIGILLIGVSFLGLRQKVGKVRSNSAMVLEDMLPYLSVVSSSRRGITVRNAIYQLSNCAEEKEIAKIIQDEQWRKMVQEEPNSTAEEYRMIGDIYGIELFNRLAEQVEAIDLGLSAEDVYLRLALSCYKSRLTESRLRVARAKVRITIPVALMLLPLLALLLIPLFFSISTVLS